MRWENIVNENEVKKAIDILKPGHQLFEVRILGTDKRKVLSGYFTDSAQLINAFDTVDLRNANVYITLNEVNEALYSRSQHDKFVANTNTTSDTEVDRYQWLFIDLDPCRPTNISSSDAELSLAKEMAEKIKAYLHDIGFSAPVEALSGNGYHLLYRIDLLNNTENIQLVSDCLTVLSKLFNTDRVKVDTTNCNPSRICKLHGTLAQKGSSTEARPHRMSKILFVPDNIAVTPENTLRALVGELPEEPKRMQKQSYVQREFDVKDWLSNNGISYKEDAGRDCTMLLLDECPFDHNHRNGDAKIFSYTDGAIAFKCHHNSCKAYKWQDVRLLFEPDAYDVDLSDEKIEAGFEKRKTLQAANHAEVPKPKKQMRKLKTAAAVLDKDLQEPVVFVGVDNELPILVEGTCILSAKPKLGKSWLALAMCIAIAKGEDFLGYKTKKCSTLYLDLETSEQLQQKRIRKVLNGTEVPTNFYIDTETDSIDKGFIEQIENYLEQDPDIGVVVIDVFQIIRSSAKSIKETEYEHAYRDISPLNALAQKYHIAIMLVCHDRKAVDVDDPFSNILGSTGLQGAATQMMVMFRKSKDDPIHISIKGKTIDGLPELDVKLEEGQWSITKKLSCADAEEQARYHEYYNSDIRKVVCMIAEKSGAGTWKGNASAVIEEAVQLRIGLNESSKSVGGFLCKFVGMFLKQDNILITIIQNGSGGRYYEVTKNTLMTVDENFNF